MPGNGSRHVTLIRIAIMRLLLSIIGTLLITASSSALFAAGGKRTVQATFSNPANLSMVSTFDENAATLDSTTNQKLDISISMPIDSYSFEGTYQNTSGKISSSTYYFIPEIHYSHRLNQYWVLGFKLGRPYWININYPANSDFSTTIFPIQRTLKVFTLSPEAAYDIRPWLTFGAGIDISNGTLITKDTLTSATNIMTNNLSAWAAGWHAGLLIKPWLGGFIGLSYYSSQQFNTEGYSEVNGNKTYNATSTLNAPSSYRISYFQALNKQFGLMASAEYTGWSALDSITINTQSGPIIEAMGYSDTWQYSLGGRYQAMKNLVINAGVSYDTSPSNPDLKTPTSIEPQNYWSAGLSANYALNQALSLQLSYGHAFLSKHQVNTSDTNGTIEISSNQLTASLEATF
jgi:long-subunit fatty acid transport protein